MFIDHQMAQKIVDRATRIVGSNVNVMNHHGVIIGTGESDRLNQIHEGAVHVLSSQEAIDIDSTQEGLLQGVKRGVNLPVLYSGDVVGVVGITGDPGKVRKYADLVVMTAELVIEHVALLAEPRWDERQRESIILRLIEGNSGNPVSDDRLALLNINLSVPRVAVVFKVSNPDNGQIVSIEMMQKVLAQLSNSSTDNLAVISSQNHITLLPQIEIRDGVWNHDLTCRLIERQYQQVSQNIGVGLKVGVGDYFDDADLPRSYEVAMKTLSVGCIAAPAEQLYFCQRFALDTMLYEAVDNWGAKLLVGQYVDFLKLDKHGVLKKTLVTYLSQNLSISDTAAVLHIHKNTLRYRLDKISEFSGRDLNNLNDLISIFSGIRLYELYERAELNDI